MPFSMKPNEEEEKIAIISQTHGGHPDTIVQSRRSSAIHSESYMAAEYLVQYTAGGNRALNACFEVAAAAALTPKSVAPNSKQNLRKPTTQSVHLVRKRHNAVLRSTFFRRRKKVLPKQIVQPPLSEVKPVLLFLFFVLFFVMHIHRNYFKK